MEPFEPEVDVDYLFAKDYKGHRWEVVYTRCADGSGGMIGAEGITFNRGPRAWLAAFNYLRSKGYKFVCRLYSQYVPPTPENADDVYPPVRSFPDPDDPEYYEMKQVLDEILGKSESKDIRDRIEKHRRKQKKTQGG
jgi:hypothetical protein